MIEIFASASIGAIVGFGVCAALTAGKIADVHSYKCRNCSDAGWVCENHPDMPWGGTSSDPHACECGAGAPCRVCEWDMATSGIKYEADIAHARCADALSTAQSRIERALGCVTENSAHVGKKMAAILKGERL